jgi:hypothetical protein
MPFVIFFVFFFVLIINFRRFFAEFYCQFLSYHFRLDKLFFYKINNFLFRPRLFYFFEFFIFSIHPISPVFVEPYFFMYINKTTVIFFRYFNAYSSLQVDDNIFHFPNTVSGFYFYNLNNKSILFYL